jgi:1-phosphofructokinase family hexose kinase
MILTITANSALDKVIFIEEFKPTTVMRTRRVVESVGGKGFDTSVVLQTLGVDNLAIGLVAGEPGRQLAKLLECYGIRCDLVWAQGDTRTAYVIVETKFHHHSHITTGGYRVGPVEVQALLSRCHSHIKTAQGVVCAGSLPEGMPKNFYRTVTNLAHQAGIPTLIDCPGEPMLQALLEKPDIVKINRNELSQTFGIAAGSLAELAEQVQRLRRREDLPAFVVTCGEEGILAITGQGSYRAIAPPQEEVNAAGAGDAVSAALVWRLALRETWQQALCWAAAASAAVVLTEGTADCRLPDIERIFNLVEVHEM